MPKMRWSIRNQLLVPLLTLLLGLVGISVWTGFASANRARWQIETQIRDVARTLSENPFPLTPNVLQQMKGLSGAEYLLIESNGDCIATVPADPRLLPDASDQDQGPILPPGTHVRIRDQVHVLAGPKRLPIAPVTDDWHALHLEERIAIGEQSYLCSGVRLQQGPNAGATLYILYPESRWRDARFEAVVPSLALGIFGGLASVAMAVLVAQRLSRRIQELEKRTRMIAAGDFSPMPLPRRNDELRDLTRSVNEMAQRLALLQETVQKTERLRLLGQVSGGLAHQLRNGVTGARLAVQLHARECTGGGDSEALEVALRQLALVEANLRRFLDLGRTGELRCEPCLLFGLIDETVTLLRPQCRHARVDLRWQRPVAPSSDGQPIIRGDASQLGQLFLNVISNAMEAAGPGGWVEVQVHLADGKSAIIEVTDSGPGPPPEIAGRLFEPFITGKREGVGLGLAVAHQVAEMHCGSIQWQRRDDRTCFRIEIPVAGWERNRALSP